MVSSIQESSLLYQSNLSVLNVLLAFAANLLLCRLDLYMAICILVFQIQGIFQLPLLGINTSHMLYFCVYLYFLVHNKYSILQNHVGMKKKLTCLFYIHICMVHDIKNVVSLW